MVEQPVQWTTNRFKSILKADAAIQELLPPELPRRIRSFHRQLPGYRMSPLKGLSNLADRLGLGGIWVKDESRAPGPPILKVLGGSYAIFRLIRNVLALERKGILFFPASPNGNNFLKKLG